MTPTMCFLFCAVTLLSFLSCRAQLTPLLFPLTPIRAPLRPGLLAMPAARLAATTAAVNTLSQGAKITKAVIGKPVGLSLAAKAAKLPTLPIVTPIKPLKSPKVGSALLKSKIPKKATSVRLRSIDDEEGAKYLESLKSDEQSDTFPAETVTQNPDFPNENSNKNFPDRLLKPRSPDEIESLDELDYLTRAANPSDESESGFKSFIHKIEHGVENTFHKIGETFRPHSKEPQQEEKDTVSSPYALNDQSDNRIFIDNKAVEEYMRNFNNEKRLMLNYPYETQNIESVRNALDQFQQRMSSMRSQSDDEDALSKVSNNGATVIEDIQKLLTQYSDDKPASEGVAENYLVGNGKSNQQPMDYPYFISTNGLQYNPEYDGIWNPYNDMMSKMANAYFGNGYAYDQYPSPYENRLYQPVQVSSKADLYKRDTPSEDLEASTTVPTLIRNSRQMSPFTGMPAGGIVNAALGLSQGIMGGDYDKISKAGVNLGTGIASTATGNSQQMSPTNFGRMPAGGIVNSALDLSKGIMRGDYDKISQAGVNLGSGIASTATGNSNPDYYNNGNPSKSQNLWNSANDLASGITNAAKNPNNVGTDQVFGSIDKIWNSANNLASNIGEGSSGNAKNSPLASLMNNKYTSGAKEKAGNIYNSATDLASRIANVAKNPSQAYNAVSNPLSNLSKDQPIGSIYNSANNLAQSIAKPTTGLGNQAKMGTLNELLKLNAAANQATGMAGNSANSAINSGNSGLNQLLGYNNNAYPSVATSGVDMAKQIVGAAMMQNYLGGPTYAGGYFPRDSQADNVWNSANALASNIYNAGMYPSMSGNQGFNSFYDPFNSIWGSATNLAQDITNTAMYNRMGEMPYYYY